MKVTKAKGLKTDLTEQVARTHEQDGCDSGARWPRKRCIREIESVESNESSTWFVATAASQIGVEPLCFAYFHLGPQMKVGRPPAETGALSRSEPTA
jgi:hypothetical protein